MDRRRARSDEEGTKRLSRAAAHVSWLTSTHVRPDVLVTVAPQCPCYEGGSHATHARAACPAFSTRARIFRDRRLLRASGVHAHLLLLEQRLHGRAHLAL